MTRSRRSRVAVFAMAFVVPAVWDSAAGAGSWAQLRSELEQRGLTPSVVYDGDVAANLAGGRSRGATYLGNLHVQLGLDGERLLGATGLTAFLDGLVVHGGQPSDYAGDAQGVSNIAAPQAVEPYEAWLEYNFAWPKLSVLAGLYDLNSEFYRLQSADLFLNSSFGIGPEFAFSGVAGPSIFPDDSLGLRLAYKPTERVVFRGAVMDGVPLKRPGGWGAFQSGDGLLLVGEAALLRSPAATTQVVNPRFLIGRGSIAPPYEDKIALGGWYYTARFDDLSQVAPDGSPRQHRGNGGAYLLADALLYQARDAPGRRLSAFLQAGIGDDQVYRFNSYIGAGLATAGFMPGRPGDEMGLAVAAAINSAHYEDSVRQQAGSVNGAEIALELTYLAHITGWLAVQPDLQYVIHPNTEPSLRNALVFQLQFEVSF